MRLYKAIARNGNFQIWAKDYKEAFKAAREQEPKIEHFIYLLPIEECPGVLTYEQCRDLIFLGYTYEEIMKFDQIQERVLTRNKN